MHRRLIGLAMATAFAASGTSGQAETMPARKAGLWESTTITADQNVTARQCIDANTDQFAQGVFGGGQNCSKNTLTKTSAGYEGASACTIGTVSAVAKSVITGDFDSKIHMVVDTTLTGLPGAKEPVQRQMVIDATYLGPCETGQSPGDIILPGGKVVKMPNPAAR